MSDRPERIFLHCEFDDDENDALTWDWERIADGDTEYVRADLYARLTSELAKWEKPFGQKGFEATRVQADRGDSLAAQRVYITALEHALKHKEAELADWESAADKAAHHPCADEQHCSCVPLLVAKIERAEADITELQARVDAGVEVWVGMHCVGLLPERTTVDIIDGNPFNLTIGKPRRAKIVLVKEAAE